MAFINIQKIAGTTRTAATPITIGASGTGRLLVVMGSAVGTGGFPTMTINGVNASNVIHTNVGAGHSIQYWLDADLPAIAGAYDVTQSYGVPHLFYAENAPQVAPTISSSVVEGDNRSILLPGAGSDYVKVLATRFYNTTTPTAHDVDHSILIATESALYAAIVNEGSLESIHVGGTGFFEGAAAAFRETPIAIPVLSLPTQDSVTDTTATVGVTTNEANGDLYAVVSALQPSAAQIKLGQNSTGVAAPSANKVVTSTDEAITVAGLTASTTYTVWMLQSNTAGDSNFVSTSVTTAAPSLTSPTATATSTTTLSGSVSVAATSGTLYWYVDADATPPTAAALKAGTGAVAFGSQAVTVTGTQTIASMAGLTEGATYYVHYLYNDGVSDSNLVTTAAVTTFTKSATVAGITGGASLTGLDYAVFAGHDISTMTLLTQGAGASTDVSGNLTIALTGLAGNNGDPLLILLGDWTTTVAGTNKAAVCYTTMSVG